MGKTDFQFTDSDLQDFIRCGYVILTPDYPPKLHQTIQRKTDLAFESSDPGNRILQQVPELQQVFNHPDVHQTLTRIVGPNYIMHPHRHCHVNPPQSRGQGWHQDGTPRRFNGWNHPWRRHHHLRLAMAFYYPQDVSENMGGTGILPGTQYQSSLKRDDEFIGEIARENQSQEFKIFGSAGTIAIVHYDIWHRATANTTDRHRYMMKFLFQRCTEPISVSPNSKLNAKNTLASQREESLVVDYHWHWFQGHAVNKDSSGTPYTDKEVNMLIDRLGENYPESERTETTYQLGQLGESVTDLLLEKLQNGVSEPARLNVAAALSVIGQSAIPGLKEVIMNSGDWWIQATAADSLGDIGKPAAGILSALMDTVLNPRLSGIENPDSQVADLGQWVRRNAIYALATIAESLSETIPVLTKALKDEHPFIRLNAINALVRIHQSDLSLENLFSDFESDLRYALGDEHPRVAEYAADGLYHCFPVG